MNKPFETPFKAIEGTGLIIDRNDMPALTIRGWGSLTGAPHKLGEAEALAAQDKFEREVVRDLNLHESLVDALEEADHNICRMCKKINPQHADCYMCPERDDRLKLIAKAKKMKAEEAG